MKTNCAVAIWALSGTYLATIVSACAATETVLYSFRGAAMGPPLMDRWLTSAARCMGRQLKVEGQVAVMLVAVRSFP